MQRAKRQVPGFCDSQGRLDRFQISHFADQHHIRILRRAARNASVKLLGVRVQLTLVDQFLFMWTNSIGSSIVRM